MKSAPQTRPDGHGLRVAVAHSAFNAPVVQGLLHGALAALREMGVDERDVGVFEAPGAFELPLIARTLALCGRFDAVVALGAVIRGETDHYEHVARESAAGLGAVARETGVPVGFGVLTVRRAAQAARRAAPGRENKGAEAARAAVATARVLQAIARRPTARGRGRAARRRV